MGRLKTPTSGAAGIWISWIGCLVALSLALLFLWGAAAILRWAFS